MSYTFTVNGITRTTEEEKPLLRYLRDDLKLYSVKDGCSEGACGTCTVLIDGKPMRSCVITTARAVGKDILTVEGLSLREKETFVFAFGSCGSVQCGFCIPGMVLAAKALIDQNPDPTTAEIKKAKRSSSSPNLPMRKKRGIMSTSPSTAHSMIRPLSRVSPIITIRVI